MDYPRVSGRTLHVTAYSSWNAHIFNIFGLQFVILEGLTYHYILDVNYYIVWPDRYKTGSFNKVVTGDMCKVMQHERGVVDTMGQ